MQTEPRYPNQFLLPTPIQMVTHVLGLRMKEAETWADLDDGPRFTSPKETAERKGAQPDAH